MLIPRRSESSALSQLTQTRGMFNPDAKMLTGLMMKQAKVDALRHSRCVVLRVRHSE